jgi:hypothetical protein
MDQQNIAILTSLTGRHPISMSNPDHGTVAVSIAAYYRFRELGTNIKLLRAGEPQARALYELNRCFGACEYAGRDDNGNVLLCDDHTDITFVVDPKTKVIVGVYGRPPRRWQQPRAQARAA